MKLHPRTFVVQAAQVQLNDAVLAVVQQHDLTFVELAQTLNEAQARWLKYALRAERHPDDPHKGGDQA